MTPNDLEPFPGVGRFRQQQQQQQEQLDDDDDPFNYAKVCSYANDWC